MLVVPGEEQIEANSDVADIFFNKIFGQNGRQIQYSFIAFSSFGNIIVQTFTAARVKQEIAKEGILPFSRFFANNYSFIPAWLRRRNIPNNGQGEAPQAGDRSGDTPVGALLLHWSFAILLIVASIPTSTPDIAYKIYVNLYSFTIDAFFGFLVGLTLIHLRLRWLRAGRPDEHFSLNIWVSVSAAFVFTVANMFPLIAVWIPPSANDTVRPPYAWFATGTIGMGVVALAVVYWLVLHYVIPSLTGLHLEVEKETTFKHENGYWVFWHEIVTFSWRT